MRSRHSLQVADHFRFPVYKPKNNKFSIWGESYAGHWAPTFADYFETQNERIADGTLDKSAVPLRLETLGIVNGCLDPLQIQFYPHMAYNSTYEGLQIINKTVYDAAVESWPACQEKVNTCRSLAKESDPLGRGNNATVNKACSLAFGSCFDTLHDYYPKDVSFLHGCAECRPLIQIPAKCLRPHRQVPWIFST